MRCPRQLRIVALVLATACSVSATHHDPTVAARAALAFAEVALLRRDVETSYAMLSKRAAGAVPLEEYRGVLARMHPSAFPLTLTATEYEPIPGQRALSIFLEGENGDERFFYRLAMEVASGNEYRVLGIYRGSGPYPPNRARKKLDQGLFSRVTP